MEKWVKVLHAQAPGHLGVKQVWNTVIKMVLVMLPVDSCIKSAVGQWTASWSSLPGGLTVRGKLVFCLIIVVILIGLGRVYRLCGVGGGGGGKGEGEVGFWSYEMGESHKGMGPFLWGKLTPKDTM